MRTVRSYSPTSEAIPAARHCVGHVMKGADPDDIYAVELMVSELATNCVRHGGTGFELVVDLTAESLRVEVTDGGSGRPVVQSPSPTEPTGRGLLIVDALSDRWGVETGGGRPGKTVWFVYRLQRSALEDPVDRLGLDVQATQEPGHDLLLGPRSDDGDRDHELAGQASDRPPEVVDEHKLSTPVKALRVSIGSEGELS